MLPHAVSWQYLRAERTEQSKWIRRMKRLCGAPSINRKTNSVDIYQQSIKKKPLLSPSKAPQIKTQACKIKEAGIDQSVQD
jgi:hypothetical protein